MQKIRVGIVDDHELFRKGVIGILDPNRFEVVLEAENGQAFIDRLDSVAVDVVLLDLEMPVLDGMEACKRVRERFPELKILILTMHRAPHFMVHMMENGANGYLVKESGPDELEEALERVYRTGYFFNDALSRAMLLKLEGGSRKVPKQMLNDELSEREAEVLRLICEELTTPEIADKLYLSPRTVEGYRKQLLEKTGARNTAGLVLWAVRQGIMG